MTAQTVHIIGSGLVGPLMAIFLARKGFAVELYERRGDMRKTQVAAGRSINLALTARGLAALDAVGLKDEVMKISIPMRGRMVHDTEGNTTLYPYGQKDHEVIYAASRGLLNIMLLDAAEKFDNIRIHFDMPCTAYDVKTSTLTFPNRTVKADTVIGADGAWSVIRKAMQTQTDNFSYAQDFLEYGYKELVIPPDAAGGFRMEKNALHIWPHKNYMMIALPNTEGSFTLTLFYPYEGFDKIKTDSDVIDFFKANFTDALPLMPTLVEDFFNNPTGALVTVKCKPWHHGNTLLIGDAAHAIVPFFGQGMNSGFEDCLALDGLIDGKTPDWKKVFTAFEKIRKPNTDAIADMAVENFVEMRDSMTDPYFLFKKKIGFELEKRWPNRFIPRYSMVIFRPDIPYAEAKRRGVVQDAILDELCGNVSSIEQIDWQKAESLILEKMPPLAA